MDLFATLGTQAKSQPTSRPEITNYAPLKKGQKVNLRSGKSGFVEGFSINYFWMGKEALPYSRSEILWN